ncbi:MAG: hypothetical protein KA796_03610 [Chryseobacterium sp.]|nr:hypothetical protein [Chryseobacterium sp.]MBP7498938.1 hypothetical protein [Chryseobacterium sp.]
MKNIFWIFGLLMLLTSCGGDDDICLNSDSTPRLKLKFRNSNDQLIRMDTLYIDVDFGKDSLRNTTTAVAVDSVLVPLRIDDSSFTDFYVRTRKAGPRSKIRVNYEAKSIYVSPACGFKRNYENLKPELSQPDPVQSIQTNVTSLTDENRINFYLRF